MGQKIGLHKDGEELGLSPFEAEIRRRVWWQIMMLDTVYALMSGLGQSLLPRNWSTRVPHNVNDADLFPAMTSIQSRDGPTDMIFCLMQYEIGKILVQVPSLEIAVLHNERATAESPKPADIAKACQYIDELDDNISNLLEKFCDLSMGPVHELAMEMRPTWVAKLRDLVKPPTDPPEWGTELHTQKDNLFKMAVTGGEHNLNMYGVAKNTGQFVWFGKSRRLFTGDSANISHSLDALPSRDIHFYDWAADYPNFRRSCGKSLGHRREDLQILRRAVRLLP